MNTPYTPDVGRERVSEVKRVLDELPAIEAAVPGLAGRVDRSRVAAAART